MGWSSGEQSPGRVRSGREENAFSSPSCSQYRPADTRGPALAQVFLYYHSDLMGSDPQEAHRLFGRLSVAPKPAFGKLKET